MALLKFALRPFLLSDNPKKSKMKTLQFCKKNLFVLALLVVTASCHSPSSQKNSMTTASVNHIPPAENFVAAIDGKKTSLYILKNKNGMEAAITNYGGRLVSLMVPDSGGRQVDVVAGFESVQGFQHSTEPYFGATIGRFGNRIAGGKFTLEGKEYTLYKNNGPNTLHGGKKGFQDEVWDVTLVNDSILELRYLSKDMEEGFPGNLSVKVTYTLTADNRIQVNYEATTDKPTVLNLTNHAFFNLNGTGSGTILNHLVEINADTYTPVNATLIPTGKLEPVAGTPFDFRKVTAIGARIGMANEQLKDGNGYDHNYVLNKHLPDQRVARVEGDKTGIIMDVYTQEPGMQFYSGNFMAGKNTMKSGTRDEFRTAFAMETQHFPDSPNQPQFPSTVLKPGEVYKTETSYKFSR